MPRPPADREPFTGPDAPLPSRRSPSGRPTMLALACALVLVEVAVLLVAAVTGVAALVRGGDVGTVLFLVALASGAAALLAGAARGLWRGRRWGRAPVLTAQAFVVVTAATWWSDGGGLLVLVPVVVALVVVVAVLRPEVVAATSRGRDAAG